MSGMDGLDRRLRDLLDAAAGEPPHVFSVETVRRRVARRRALECVAGAAAVAVIAVAIPAGLGVFGHLSRPAEPTQRPPAHALYVYSYVFTCCGAFGGSHGTVTPVNTATNTPGTPIHVGAVSISGGGAGEGAGQIVITPGGKTAYATTGPTVTPISTATGTPGTPIHVRGGPTRGIAITPDGKTVYATTSSGTVNPISTATNTPGTPIHVSGGLGYGVGQIAITPDGRTAYVTGPGMVTPINTATNTPGRPIHIGPAGGGELASENIAITPDGKTAYVTNSDGAVTPVNTATNAPGKPIQVGQPGGLAGNIAITPDGNTVYAAALNECLVACEKPTITVVSISTATNTPGKRVTVATGGFGNLGQIAITPDGKTVYVTTGSSVTPISTATATPGKPIHVGVPGLGAKSLFRLSVPAGSLSRFLGRIVITPDGKTAYVSTGSSVTPISTATGTPGKPIHVGGNGFQAMVITP